jgi:Ca2+-binding RTX toxin-like protein
VRVDLSRGTATGQGHDSITRTPAKVWGSDYGDVIIGTDQADQIVAGRGADVVRGRGGNDEITVDPGPRAGASDTVFAGAGHDHVETGGGQDLLYGGSGSDIVETTGPGPDRIFTGDGRDIIEYRLQSQGRQSLSAGREPAERTPGARTLGDELHLYGSDVNPDQLPASGSFNMSTGELTYRVDGHQVVRMPAQGVEDLSLYDFGPEATWKIRGTAHDNDVDPGGNGTRFEGLAGDDEFTGTGGDDWYDGGPGNDVGVRMGDGNDTCISVEDFISSNPCSAPTQTDPNALLLATLVAWSRRTPLSSK